MTPPTRSPPRRATCGRCSTGAHGDVGAAVLGYNHSPSYVADVLARARAYASDPDAAADRADGRARARRARTRRPAPRTSSSPSAASGRARTRCSRRGRWRRSPGRARSTPACSTTRSGSCAPTTCASPPRARRATTRTATAPRSTSCPPSRSIRRRGTRPRARWPAISAGHRRARAQGSRPACPLVPAIQFVGYDGYPDHGSPRTCAGTVRRPPAPLVGLAVFRHIRAVAAVCVGAGLYPSAVERLTRARLTDARERGTIRGRSERGREYPAGRARECVGVSATGGRTGRCLWPP